MKKISSALVLLLMIVGFTACSANSAGEQSSAADSASSASSNKTSQSEKNSGENTTNGGNSKILVAYFSATGTTKSAAQTISDTLGADLYEITPADPYTDADLDYNDSNSRSTVEMNNPNARPEISGSVENMEKYDTVFIGYPIWWSDAPRIVSTFVESYDFGGKTIVPFCTSGGSGIGSSAANLEKLTSGATWLDGKRLSGSVSQSEIKSWVDDLGL